MDSTADLPPAIQEPTIEAGSHDSAVVGGVIGGTIGGVVLIAVFIALVVVPIQRRRKQDKQRASRAPKSQMMSRDPHYILASRPDILMEKQGYSSPHHPTNSDLVGVMPLLGSGVSESNHERSTPSAYPLGSPSQDFDPYTPYNGRYSAQPYQARSGEGMTAVYPAIPRPPQDVHARPAFTTYLPQPRSSPHHGSPRALPRQPGSPSVRPLPIPVASGPPPPSKASPVRDTVMPVPLGSSRERDVPPQYRGARPVVHSSQPAVLDDPFRVPSPPPSVSAFPSILQRYRSVSSISDSDSISIYSQMSMSRSNTLVRDGNLTRAPSLATVAERLANDAGMDRKPTKRIAPAKSIKGKEKAIPEEESDGEHGFAADDYPVITPQVPVEPIVSAPVTSLRKLPTPPSPPPPAPPTTTATRRPLPIVNQVSNGSTVTTNSHSSNTTHSTSATDGSGSVSLFFSDSVTSVSHSNSSGGDGADQKQKGLKRMDTVAIGNLLQSRARRHSDAAYVALDAASEDSDDGMYSTVNSISRILGWEEKETQRRERSRTNGEEGEADKRSPAGGLKAKPIEHDAYGKIVRNPVVTRVKSVKKPAPVDGSLARGGPPPPIGPRSSLRPRPRAISGPGSPTTGLSGGVANLYRAKSRTKSSGQPSESAASSTVSLPRKSLDGHGRTRSGSEGQHLITPRRGDGHKDRKLGREELSTAPATGVGMTPVLPPIPTSPSLYPLTNAFGLGGGSPSYSPNTPTRTYDLDRASPFLRSAGHSDAGDFGRNKREVRLR